MKLSGRKLNIEYSVLQCLYWMISGVVFGFSTVYLQYKSYSNYEIGLVFALGNIVSFALQPIVAGIVDRSERRALIKCIRLTAFVSLLLISLVFLMPSSCLPLTVSYILLIAGNLLLQPLCISLSIYIESWGHPINFSAARGIGSLGYAICTVGLGILVDKFSPVTVPLVFFIITAIFGSLTIIFSRVEKSAALSKDNTASPKAGKTSSVTQFIAENKRFCILLIGVALLYFTHSILGNFMIEFIRGVGGGSSDLGIVLAFMAMTEVPMMLLFSKLLHRFGCSALLKLSVIMFSVKALVFYLAPSMTVLYIAVALQMFSFAIFTPASVVYVSKVIIGKDAVKGQTFVTTMITLGSIFASYVGGYILDNGGASQTLLVAFIVSAVGTLIALPSIQKTK